MRFQGFPWEAVLRLATQSWPTTEGPPEAPPVLGILQTRTLEWVAMPPPGDLPNPGTEPGSSTLQVDSLPSESPGKSTKTGVGSLSLVQRNFPTQESNQGVQHCRQILYQQSYPESPMRGYVCTMLARSTIYPNDLGLGFLLWIGKLSLLEKGPIDKTHTKTDKYFNWQEWFSLSFCLGSDLPQTSHL